MIKICIIGLGYVGLPLCLKISKKYKTVGFDINHERIKELNHKKDANKEFKVKEFNNKKIYFTSNVSEIRDCNFYIICVPTPVKSGKLPDLTPIKKSFETLSKIIKKNDIIVLESTVYPGVTSNFIKFLEKKTKLINNKDFYTCYSPERINPGDKKNNLTNINKIFAINTKNKNIIKIIKDVYDNFCKKLIITNLIKESETAKVIENIQRDLNIAIFNEILMICERLNINFSEVIKLAKTKWNFINFQPGLVGGHCLPVDPFYLAHVAATKGLKTITTLAGRKTNDNMENYIIKIFHKFIKKRKLKKNNLKILVVGLSYKYGVADIRNSLNLRIYNKIKKLYKKTYAFDPFVVHKNFKIKIDKNNIKSFDAILFLSKGSIYKKLFKEINKTKPEIILDPFFYYQN